MAIEPTVLNFQGEGRLKITVGYAAPLLPLKTTVDVCTRSFASAGGDAVISGRLRVNTVFSARSVAIYDNTTKKYVASTTSDPVTGFYEFTGLIHNKKYFTVGFDNDGTYKADVSDNLVAKDPGLLPFADQILADNPVGYWKLDEASAPFIDSTGIADLSVVEGALAYGSSPLVQDSTGSLEFPATLSSVGDLGTSALTKNYTIEVWVRFDTLASSDFGMIVAHRPSSSISKLALGTWYQQGGRVGIETGLSDNSMHILISTDPLDDGAVHHIVATREDDLVSLYVDGELDDTLAIPDLDLRTVSGTGHLGKYGSANSFGFIGDMGHLAIYDKALTAAQVYNHYELGKL